jgi:predicted nucleic acid-binding protein
MTRPVLLDNTVLTNLALVGRADLVTHLWGAAASTTPAVMAEYQAGVAGGLLPSEAWLHLPALTLTERETTFADNLPSHLGEGERSCLTVAVHRQGLLASDDRDARRIAQRHNVPVTGTVGILVLCVLRDYLSRDQADALLAMMRALGYRSPVVSLAPLLGDSS